jgi:CRISPR-associated protein Csx14
MPHQPTTTFIATVAGGPQIVTFALDELLRRGETVDEVIAVHLSPQADPLIGEGLSKLAAEFSDNGYQGRPCQLHFHPIRRGVETLDDIYDETTANVAWSAVHDLVADLKAEDHRLHACIAGSRRILALLFMSAAMLHFDHMDRLWHLYTPQPFLEHARDGKIMHATPDDGVQLIQAPLMPLGAYFPGLQSLRQASPAQVIETQSRLLDQTERQRCQAIYKNLTSRQQDVLRAFAGGKTPQEVAETLHISLATVDSHKTPILDACRNTWNVPPEMWLDYHFLRDKFRPFLDELV